MILAKRYYLSIISIYYINVLYQLILSLCSPISRCPAQSRDVLHNLEMFASTQDLEFVQGQSRDVPDRELGPNIFTVESCLSCDTNMYYPLVMFIQIASGLE